MYIYPRKYWYILLAFAAMATLYLYNPFQLFFLADDFLHIPESAKSLWVQQNSLRPVGNFSLHIDYWFSNTNPLGYHVTNLIIHMANTVLVYVLAKKLSQTNLLAIPNLLPLMVAIFFFTYPFHSEAVFWIIGRSGSLGCLFFLAALICFFQKDQSKLYAIFLFVFFHLALFSYESSWIFPVAVLCISLINYSSFNKHFKKQLGYLLALIIQFAIHLYIRFFATGELMNNYDAASFTNLNIAVLASNFIKLLARTFMAPMLNHQHFVFCFIAAFIVLCCLVFMLIKLKKVNRSFIGITTIWLVSYLPYLSLGIDTHGVEGERYLYLPSVFFSIWLMYLLTQLLSTKKLVVVFALLLVANFYFLNQSRTYYTKAGNITATTIEQINKLSTKEIIFFEKLPQYNKGAVVFRTGLEDAIQWLGKNKKKKIIVVSKDNSDEVPTSSHQYNFELNFVTDTTIRPINKILVKDQQFKKNYTPKDTFNLYFNPKLHAMFKYSNTKLTIIR